MYPIFLNLNLFSVFPPLVHYEVNAIPVTESDYPWIARVIHSRYSEKPHMCTATCIHPEIFITAYRCIHSLHLPYIRVIYNTEILNTKAIVSPSNNSKQSYDDIGFIVVHKGYRGTWYTVDLFNINRTDSTYKWYSKLTFNDTHKVVGYALKKDLYKFRTADTEFRLTELEVYIEFLLCKEVFTFSYLMGQFNVPCYHSCTLEEYRRDEKKCDNYHGVEGGAVINMKTNRLLGLATWGAYYSKYELPVGMSVVNSKNFFESFSCAKKIQKNEMTVVAEFYYQNLCDKGTSNRRFHFNMF
ncbi:unnamed protein product [Colias eurytheme]|nr:unnamed protein product [Colias eurytheme]